MSKARSDDRSEGNEFSKKNAKSYEEDMPFSINRIDTIKSGILEENGEDSKVNCEDSQESEEVPPELSLAKNKKESSIMSGCSFDDEEDDEAV